LVTFNRKLGQKYTLATWNQHNYFTHYFFTLSNFWMFVYGIWFIFYEQNWLDSNICSTLVCSAINNKDGRSYLIASWSKPTHFDTLGRTSKDRKIIFLNLDILRQSTFLYFFALHFQPDRIINYYYELKIFIIWLTHLILTLRPEQKVYFALFKKVICMYDLDCMGRKIVTTF
jgi:hypothetical protein